MYILNIASTIKKMSVNELIVVIFGNYCKRIGFVKERSYYLMKRLTKKDLLFLATKLTEKIPDPGNAKEHYQSFIRKKTKKSVKQSKIVNIKSVTTVHPKTSKIIQGYKTG